MCLYVCGSYLHKCLIVCSLQVFIWKTNFTELAGDLKENIADNASTIPKTNSQSSKLTCASKDKSQVAQKR